MAKITNGNVPHLIHVKSNQVVEGQPKLPNPLDSEVWVEGELAINYAKGYETISIINSENGVTRFSSDDYYTEQKLGSGFTGVNSANTVTSVIESNERIVSSALNDLDARKADTSAVTESIEAATSGKTDTSAFTTHTGDTSIHHTHSNKSALDGITGNVGTMAYENTSSYSSATEVETALNGKVNTTDIVSSITSANSASTNAVSVGAVMTVIAEDERVTSSALNDLETNKLDASAFTASDYYKKSETSGATEISTALGTKVNSATYTGHTADTTIHFTTGAVQTQIDNSISGKVNTSDIISAITPSNSGSTAPIATKVVAENELTVSNALNYLNSKEVVSAVTVSSNLNNVVCPNQILGNEMSGAQAAVVYVNSGATTDYTITVSTTYKTPDGNQLNLTCPKNGYCEISYLNINGTIYARGI